MPGRPKKILHQKMLRLKNVTRHFAGRPAVRDFTQEINAASTTVLLGPSGCGKSTILRLIIGLLEADSGEIYFQDSLISQANVADLRPRIGYVIQDGGLFPHLSAKSNVSLMARHLNWDTDRINARLEGLSRLVHLPLDLLDRFPSELSGGQRQRVSLMRALMLDPDLLLLDEPLAALDPMIRYELQQDLKGIFKEMHKTVVLVTHDIAEAAYLGDDILLMRAGRLVQRGSMQALLEAPAEPFVEQFIRAQRDPAKAIAKAPAKGMGESL